MKQKIDPIKYYYHGEWLGQRIYLEKGLKLNWLTKIPLFFKVLIEINNRKMKVKNE